MAEAVPHLVVVASSCYRSKDLPDTLHMVSDVCSLEHSSRWLQRIDLTRPRNRLPEL